MFEVAPTDYIALCGTQGVALVVKYSDNIHKGFLASIAIIVGILIDSVIFQDAEINGKYGLGSFMVLVSSFAYFQLTNGDLHGHHHPHHGHHTSNVAVVGAQIQQQV